MTVSNEPSDEAIEFAIKELENARQYFDKRINDLIEGLRLRKESNNDRIFSIPGMLEDKGPFKFVMRMLEQIKSKHGYSYSLQYSNVEKKLVNLLKLDESYAPKQIAEIKYAVEWAISKHNEM